jgi:hypothetical protein
MRKMKMNEQKLYDVIADWWDDVFCNNPAPVDRDGEYMDKTPTIMDLVESIENWLPKEHDTNSYKWNECIRTIKSKLR